MMFKAIISNVLFYLLFFCSSVTASIDHKNVLVIHSYHQGMPWTDSFSKGLLHSLQDDDNIEIYFKYLDARRFFSESYRSEEVRTLKVVSKEVKFDIVVVSDNAALDFILDYGEEYFPSIPVVFCGINDFELNMLKGRDNFWGIAETLDYAGTFDVIKKLFPKRKNLFIINDNSLTGVKVKDELSRVIDTYSKEFNVSYSYDFNLEKIYNKVKTLGNDDVIYLLISSIDDKGHRVRYQDFIKGLHEISKVPIFSSWDAYLNYGIIGGKLIDADFQGEDIGKLVLKVLNNDTLNLEKYAKSKSIYEFDNNIIKQFAVDLNKLPSNSLLINENNHWEEYVRIMIWIIVVLSLLIIVLIVLSLIRRYQSNKLRMLVGEKTKELSDSNKRLLELIDEKNVFLGIVAHDLRNPISSIYGISDLLLEDNKDDLPNDSLEFIKTIRSSSEYMLALVNDFLDISVIESGKMELKMQDVDYLVFLNDVVDFNKFIAQSKEIEIIIETNVTSDLILRIDPNKINQLINNLIGNAIKFSPILSVITVFVEKVDNVIITSIIDNGKGIADAELHKLFELYSQGSSIATKHEKGVGLGLAISKKIVEAHGGCVNVESKEGLGSKFYFSLPIYRL